MKDLATEKPMSNCQDMKVNNNFIKVSNISKNYGTTSVLKNVSFSIAEGEFVSIMGKSGSGKSTLLNILGGMDIPDSGNVEILNQQLEKLPDNLLTDFRRQHIGFIFQFFNLLQNITVLENIQIPVMLNNLNEAQIDPLLEEVGLLHKKHHFPHQLSGGEQQRVAIVRALIHNPSIILADEPTGSLDSDTGKHVLSILKTLHTKHRKTVLMVTHDLNLAQQADRMIILKDGQICP